VRAVPEPAANNEAVVRRLIEVWSSAAEACQGMSETQWDLPTDCPGWSVKDQLAHLVSVERMLLGDKSPALLDEKPEHVLNVIGEINEAWIEHYRQATGSDVLAEFVNTTNRRIDALRSFPPERFDEVGPSPEGEVPYRRFMDTRVLDCWAHEQDIRRAVGRPGGRNGAGESVALDRCAAAMPYVVGKKVGAPDGTCVLFIVVGLLGRHIPVVVSGGRAGVVDATPADVTVTLTMAQDHFWRLCFGRMDYVKILATGEATVTGDTSLGHRVLGDMSFMV
jgi:uncharacterized protein (TIGR03083 family)